MAKWMAKMLNFEASRPGKGAVEILRLLRLQEGQTVADVGAGGGYFTFLFSREVGEKGAVFAVDEKPGFLQFIRDQAAEKNLNNVRVIPAGDFPASLPAGGIDLIFMRNVFHHLEDPPAFLSTLKKILKPQGKMVIIDHRPGKGGGFVRIFRHFTPEEEIVRAAEKAGFRFFKRHDCLVSESFLVFG